MSAEPRPRRYVFRPNFVEPLERREVLSATTIPPDLRHLSATVVGTGQPVTLHLSGPGDHEVSFSASGKDTAGHPIRLSGTLMTDDPASYSYIPRTYGSATLKTRRASYHFNVDGPSSDLGSPAGLSNLTFSITKGKTAGVIVSVGSIQINRQPAANGMEQVTATVVVNAALEGSRATVVDGLPRPLRLYQRGRQPRSRACTIVITQTEPPKVDKSGHRVRAMFASIAGRYDFLNHFLSLNIDKSWRTFTTKTVPPEPGVPLLDCCTGTADLALAYDRAGSGRSMVIGTDFCREMLVIGGKKAKKAGAETRVRLIEGDTQRLPVPSDTFGVVTVAFGLRNVADTVKGLDEMIRAARPGGKVAILEFSRPRGKILGTIWTTFFKRVLPKVGQTLAPNDHDAYSYLPNSVMQFPDGQAMLDLMTSRGLRDVIQHPLTFGIATLYVGTKAGFADGH